MKPMNVSVARENALMKYEAVQAEIEALLKEINTGLLLHDEQAKAKGVNWEHAGDLSRIRSELADIRDRLHGMGEYTTYDRRGKKIGVSVPLTE